MLTKIKLYIKVDAENNVISCSNSIITKNASEMDYIEIHEEDIIIKLIQVEKKYFKKGLKDTFGRYNYKYIDGNVVEISEEDKPDIDLDKVNIITAQIIKSYIQKIKDEKVSIEKVPVVYRNIVAKELNNG